MTVQLRMFFLPRVAATLAIIGLAAAPVAAGQVLSPPPAADLQTQPSFLTTSAFTRLVEDKSIVVITTDGQRHEGHFTISGRAFVLRGENATATVPFEQVARVQKSTYRIRKHALIGLGVGIGVSGLLLAGVCSEGCDGDEGAVFGLVLLGGGTGLGIGAGNGAIRNARNAEADIVYDTGLRFWTGPGTSAASSRLGTPTFAREVEGKDVWITTADGTKRRGEIAVVTANDVILTGPQHASLPFDQIVTIVEVSHRIRNGLVNGLAGGMSVGMLNCIAGGYEDSDCGAGFWGLTALGAGAGALVGVLMNRDRDRDLLYNAARRTTTISFAPMLSPTRQGISFNVTWR